MASPGNQHCAICIGTPSFPIWPHHYAEHEDSFKAHELN